MKKFLSIGLIIFLSIILTGCNSSSSNDIDEIATGAGGDLSIWTFTETTTAQAEIFMDWYEKEYDVRPNVEVTVVPFGDYVSKLLPALQNGTGPDLFVLEMGLVGQFMDKGISLIQDLNEPPFSGAEIVSNNIGYTVDVGTGPNGEMFGITAQASPTGIYYRQDIADKIGYSQEDVEKAYTTEEGTLKLCQDLADNGYYCFSSPEDVEYLSKFFTLNPVDDETSTYNPEYLEAVNKFILDMQDYYAKGYVSPYIYESTEWQQQLHIGDTNKAKVFAMSNATWGMDKYLTPGEDKDNSEGTYGKWRFAKSPVATFKGGSWYYMNKDAKNKSLAWEYLEYYASNDDFAEQYSKTRVEYFASYGRQEKFKEEQTSGFLGGQNVYDVIGNELDNVQIDAYMSPYSDIFDKTVIAITQEVNAGNITKEEALNEFISKTQTAAPEVQLPDGY